MNSVASQLDIILSHYWAFAGPFLPFELFFTAIVNIVLASPWEKLDDIVARIKFWWLVNAAFIFGFYFVLYGVYWCVA